MCGFRQKSRSLVPTGGALEAVLGGLPGRLLLPIRLPPTRGLCARRGLAGLLTHRHVSHAREEMGREGRGS